MIEPPDTLVAELTYRCPLRCGCGPNRIQYGAATLPTSVWRRLFGEAAALGVLQLHLTGGEPLDQARLSALVDAGVGQTRVVAGTVLVGSTCTLPEASTHTT